MPTSSHSSVAGVLLLCVDLQPVFIKAMADRDELLKRCSFAIEVASGFGMTVMFTEQVPLKLGGTDERLLKLAKAPIVYAKTTFSAFEDNGIHDALLAQNIEHVIICGLETPVCIYQTALGALNENMQVTVLTDAIGARRPDDAASCLASLSRSGVHLLPSETVFYSLLHDVKHPFFKDYTRLVKHYA